MFQRELRPGPSTSTMDYFGKSTKRRIDALFAGHAIMAGVLGTLAVLLPHLFEWMLVHHGEKFSLRDNSDVSQKVTHLVVRLYGALILGQAWIVWHARRISEPAVRRALVQVREARVGEGAMVGEVDTLV